MPKIIDYPRKSFSTALKLAESVDHLGGIASHELVAEKFGSKGGGAFQASIGAAIKHTLIESKGGKLLTTDEYKNHFKHAYSPYEQAKYLQGVFLAPILYSKIYERYKGKSLPIDMLDKILIREFSVPPQIASRVSNYFIDGAEAVGLSVNGQLLVLGESKNETENNSENSTQTADAPIEHNNVVMNKDDSNNTGYFVLITGKDMNTKFSLNEPDDFLILEAIIKKLKKKIT